MAARAGIAPVMLGTSAVTLAYASAFLPGGVPRWGAWAMVLGIALLFVGLMILGASRRGRSLGVLVWPLAFTFVVLVGCFGAVLLFPPAEAPGAKLWLGLPARTALILYGVGALPALILPLAYARTFRAMTLDSADIERIRAARRAAGPAAPGSES